MYTRKGTYYFRTDIPSDLSHHFPVSELKKSLRTRDLKTAKAASSELATKFDRVCSLLRLGLPEDISAGVLASVIPHKERLLRKVARTLSEVNELSVYGVQDAPEKRFDPVNILLVIKIFCTLILSEVIEYAVYCN